MQNPLTDVKPENMVEGETRIVEVKKDSFFGIKKQKNVIQGKIMDYKTAVGKTREEVEQKLV